jgi:hypothetical protein
MFFTLRGSLRLLARGRVFSAHDALAALLAAQQLHRAQILDRRAMAEVMWPVIEMLAYIHDELAMYYPELAKRKELDDYFKQMRTLKRTIWESSASDESVKNLYLNLQRSGDLLAQLASGVPSQQHTVMKSPRKY